MSIGLYDADFKYSTIFNLDLMKIAAYYKSKNEIVVMSPEYNPERYGSFFVSKDYSDGEYLPYNKKTTYRGRAYGDIYSPLPVEMERMKPDITIYDKESVKNYSGFDENGKVADDRYRLISAYNHIRLSLDGKNIWDDFKEQIANERDTYLIHDWNPMAIDNLIPTLESLILHKKQRIGFKFPLQVDNISQIEEMIKLPLLTEYTVFHYDTKAEPTERSLKKVYDDALQLKVLKPHYKILLIYEPSIFSDEDKMIFDMLQNFVLRPSNNYMSLAISLRSLNEDLKGTRKQLNELEKSREAFRYCREKYPNLFRDFYSKAKGGIYL